MLVYMSCGFLVWASEGLLLLVDWLLLCSCRDHELKGDYGLDGPYPERGMEMRFTCSRY